MAKFISILKFVVSILPQLVGFLELVISAIPKKKAEDNEEPESYTRKADEDHR